MVNNVGNPVDNKEDDRSEGMRGMRASAEAWCAQRAHAWRGRRKLTVVHALHKAHVPRPDGAVRAVALAARDVAVGVRAGAVARLPGAVGIGVTVGGIPRTRKVQPTRSDAPEHAPAAGRAVPLQLRLGPRRKRRLDRERLPHRGQR